MFLASLIIQSALAGPLLTRMITLDEYCILRAYTYHVPIVDPIPVNASRPDVLIEQYHITSNISPIRFHGQLRERAALSCLKKWMTLGSFGQILRHSTNRRIADCLKTGNNYDLINLGVVGVRENDDCLVIARYGEFEAPDCFFPSSYMVKKIATGTEVYSWSVCRPCRWNGFSGFINSAGLSFVISARNVDDGRYVPMIWKSGNTRPINGRDEYAFSASPDGRRIVSWRVTQDGRLDIDMLSEDIEQVIWSASKELGALHRDELIRCLWSDDGLVFSLWYDTLGTNCSMIHTFDSRSGAELGSRELPFASGAAGALAIAPITNVIASIELLGVDKLSDSDVRK